MTLTTTLEALAEKLEALQHRRISFVTARHAMNDARPDPIRATQAERDLYDERYRADHSAERELRSAAMDFAMWAGEYDVAAAVQLAAEGWQPISTAPRDGTLIDVWIDGEFPGRRADVSWRKPTDSEWWVHGGDTIKTPDATWHDCFGPFGKSEQPTHWRPRPDAPSKLETNDEG